MNFKGKLRGVLTISDSLRGFKITRRFGELYTSKQYAPPGIDSSPPAGARPLVEAVGGDMSEQVTVSFLDRIKKIAGRGETRIYSSADGKIVSAYVFVRNDGTILFNGEEYGGLIKIQELEDKLNALVAEIRAHTHGGVGTSSTFTDFDRADFENVEITHG